MGQVTQPIHPDSGPPSWINWQAQTPDGAQEMREVALYSECLAPGLMEALIRRKDEGHGRTEEVPGRDPGAGDADGSRGEA